MNDSPLAHPEWLALVASMRFAPDDDTPRLVAADWLADTNRPELIAWGEFIRIQCEGAREKRAGHVYSDSCDCRPCACERKATTIFDRWNWYWSVATWAGGTHPPMTPPAAQYQRGFVVGVTANVETVNVADVSPPIVELFHRQPITRAMSHFTIMDQRFRGVRYALDVRATPSSIVAGMLRVRATLGVSIRPSVTVERSRQAMTMQQFPKAVGGAIRHAIKG